MTGRVLTAIMLTRETCSCGAVFESNKEATWSDVQKLIRGFREAHAPCRQGRAPMFPLGPIAVPDPCAGCGPVCGNIACPKRTVITSVSDSGSYPAVDA